MFYNYVLCVCFKCFFANVYLYNTALSVLFCVNKFIIIILKTSDASPISFSNILICYLGCNHC